MSEFPADLVSMLPIVPPSANDAMHIGFDELPFVDLGGGVEMQVLHVDLTQGLWVLRNRFAPGTQVAKHYHTGPVFAVTLKGAWFYEEFPEQVNTAGSYLFEPAASVHTLTVAKDKGPTEVWFAIFGCNVNVDAEGKVEHIIDASTILKAYRGLCAQAGVACDKVIVIGE